MVKIPGTTYKQEKKPVSFNQSNRKERLLLKWLDTKMVGFSGLCKELLYREMLKDEEFMNTCSLEDLE